MRPFLLAVVLVSSLLVSCSSPKKEVLPEVCKANLCTQPIYVCSKSYAQVELIMLGRSLSDVELEVHILKEVDNGAPATDVRFVEPERKVVELTRVKGVSGHTTRVRITVKQDDGTNLEVRSADFEEGKLCPQAM